MHCLPVTIYLYMCVSMCIYCVYMYLFVCVIMSCVVVTDIVTTPTFILD